MLTQPYTPRELDKASWGQFEKNVFQITKDMQEYA